MRVYVYREATLLINHQCISPPIKDTFCIDLASDVYPLSTIFILLSNPALAAPKAWYLQYIGCSKHIDIEMGWRMKLGMGKA